MMWLVLYLVVAVASWPFLLRAMVRSEQAKWNTLVDTEEWILYGFVALFVAALWPVTLPFYAAIGWVRRGFERDRQREEQTREVGP